MNAKVSANGRTSAKGVLKAVGFAAALLLGSSAALAESHGGGGHMGGGGGMHFSGGAHFGGGVGGPHFQGHISNFGAPHAYGGYGGGVAHYAPSYGRTYGGVSHYGYGASVGVHAGFGYRPWGGGYWHGGYWPRAYYGWSYPLYLGFLPAIYATYWWGGVPYYYVNNVYYTYNPSDSDYVAVDPPPVAANAGYSDDVNAAAAAGDNQPEDVQQASAGIIAYPRNGQSEAQQSTDKFQCHTWAKGQSGFDPTAQSSSGAGAGARTSYERAMAACLDARGYTVR